MSIENRKQGRAPRAEGEQAYVVLLGTHVRKVGEERVEVGPGEVINLDARRGERLTASGDVAPEGSAQALQAQAERQRRLVARGLADADGGEPEPLRRG